MEGSLPVDPQSFAGRKIIIAAAPTVLADQCRQNIETLGAETVVLVPDGETSPGEADVRAEERVTPWLDRLGAELKGADSLIFIGAAWRGDVVSFLENNIAGCLFYLKLAKRLQQAAPFDFLCITGDVGGNDTKRVLAARAADMWQGASRQMMKIAATECGPLASPMVANQLVVSGSPDLKAVLARLLSRPQGYVTGTSIAVSS